MSKISRQNARRNKARKQQNNQNQTPFSLSLFLFLFFFFFFFSSFSFPLRSVVAVQENCPRAAFGTLNSIYYIPFQPQSGGIKQIEQFNDIILRILRSRLESHSWNSLNSFPIVNEVSAGVLRSAPARLGN